MNIEIRDAAIEARLQKQLQASAPIALRRCWSDCLKPRRSRIAGSWRTGAINAKIRRGISQLDRGEGIPEERLDAYLTDLKAKPE